jgi:hypothetical protein
MKMLLALLILVPAASFAEESACTVDQLPSCSATVGEMNAQKIVKDCVAVSGTTSTCAANNPCQELADQIRRSCDLVGPGADKSVVKLCKRYDF